jgi:hypothetical protein
VGTVKHANTQFTHTQAHATYISTCISRATLVSLLKDYRSVFLILLLGDAMLAEFSLIPGKHAAPYPRSFKRPAQRDSEETIPHISAFSKRGKRQKGGKSGKRDKRGKRDKERQERQGEARVVEDKRGNGQERQRATVAIGRE